MGDSFNSVVKNFLMTARNGGNANIRKFREQNIGAYFMCARVHSLWDRGAPAPQLQAAQAGGAGAPQSREMDEALEAQALFKSWFVDFDPVIDNALKAGNPIPEQLAQKAAARKALGKDRKPLPDEVQRLFPSSFVETEEMGWVPEGWGVTAVEDALDINPRLSLPKGTVATYADMKAVPTTGYSISETIQKAFSGGAKFKNGDVLLARITPCLENGKTAVVDFLNIDEVGFGSTEFIVLRGKGAMRTPYVACLAREENFRNQCIQSMVGSSGRQRVQNAAFANHFLASPEIPDLLGIFHERIEPVFNSITRNSDESKTLISIRDTLLPELLSGKSSVPRSI